MSNKNTFENATIHNALSPHSFLLQKAYALNGPSLDEYVVFRSQVNDYT